MKVKKAFPKATLISEVFEQKGKDYIPSHFFAMSGIQSNHWNPIELDLPLALDFLERKTPVFENNYPPGWHLPTYEGTHLGWMKNTQQGWKNYYPMNWRLRNRIVDGKR